MTSHCYNMIYTCTVYVCLRWVYIDSLYSFSLMRLYQARPWAVIYTFVCMLGYRAPVYTTFRLDLDFGTVLTMGHWKLKIDNTNPTKTGCELGCSGKCRSSCSTSEARHHWQCSSANNLEQFWSILISVLDFVLLYTDRHGKKY